MADVDKAVPSINGWNADYIEKQYNRWMNGDEDLEEGWRSFFQGFELGQVRPIGVEDDECLAAADIESIQSRVDSLIYHYRDVGHLIARIDPLGRNLESHPLLDLSAFQLSEDMLDMDFHAERIPWGPSRMKLREIIDTMRATYCGSIGVEYMDIQNTPERRWLQHRMEHDFNRPNFSRERKVRIAKKLRSGVGFESFLHTNYVGQKRFSLEGAETLIPLLDAVIEKGGSTGLEEIVLGMAHRGRLNVLANVMQKSYAEIFSEFEDNFQPGMIMGDGDVKYHKGYSTDHITEEGKEIHLTLTANPSHLEAVDPVVMGRVRAKQRMMGDTERARAMGVLIHGDAAFAGQGVVGETLNLSQLQGYRTGGTIHIIVNNQIGFTTLPEDARSGGYCTDVAKMIQAPIFHVNGDDPEAVCHVAELAVEFRQEFKKDVVIDMYCYRRLGHNEGDEPSFTQPKLYELIRNHPGVLEIYTGKLIEEGAVTEDEMKQQADEFDQELTEAQERARGEKIEPADKPFQDEWQHFTHVYTHEPVETGASLELIKDIARSWTNFPDGFTPNKKLEKLLGKRVDAVLNGEGADWAIAEALAFGTLLAEGTPCRLSGQDSRRGTFSHRHAVIWDINTSEMYIPLNNIANDQARFCVYDSPLSEAGVLGFDYGYSLGDPDLLVCWEAQFGDFSNGAQTIIDQFISSSESKWSRASGIVMLLPHGYEGQGPEHSNGFLERYLQLCAEDNIQVCNATTPAQFFHLLRRQMKRKVRKPLVVMTPKSLLRHPKVQSPLSDLEKGHFHEILDDQSEEKDKIGTLILCSGKIYYELQARKEEQGADEFVVLRMEQFHPFPKDQLAEVLRGYPNAKNFVWCQEEPQNRGGWSFVSPLLKEHYGIDFRYVGRARSASPAVGSLSRHRMEQEKIIAGAFAMSPDPAPMMVES